MRTARRTPLWPFCPDALEIGTLQVQLTIRDQAVGEKLSAFRRNDKLLYYHRDALRGTYYIERVQRTGKYSYELKANDAVALLEQSTHYGGIYTGQTVAQVVAHICNIPYLIQTRFAGVKLYGWLPIATRRDNLIQVLFAVGANTKVDQNGTLRIESLWDGVASSIPEDRVFLGDSVQYAARVTQVSVLEHQYIPGSETVDLFDGTAAEGDIIQFSEPVYDLSAEGFSVLESGANYAKLSAGTGKLDGEEVRPHHPGRAGPGAARRRAQRGGGHRGHPGVPGQRLCGGPAAGPVLRLPGHPDPRYHPPD